MYLNEFGFAILPFLAAVSAVTFHPLSGKPGLIDNGTFGPTVEVVHLFQDNAPIGVSVTPSGRAFITFNRGDLQHTPFTLVEIVSDTVVVPFPNAEINTPPQGLVNTSSGRALGSSDSKHFINVQAAVVDAKNRLWALDTGRPGTAGGDLLRSVPGGPKLLGFDLNTNATAPFTTITFPETTLPPTGYLNDIRIDLRASFTKSGQGVAYIADSGAFGIIVVDLGTGESWRHLDRLHPVTPVSRFLPTIFGVPTYLASPLEPAFHYENAGGGGGCDAFTISADGSFIYFMPLSSRNLYRVETAALRANPNVDNLAFIKVANSVQFLGEIGGQADGIESDATGRLYLGSPEHNAVNTYDPSTGLVSPFVRSPVIAWPDTFSVADDGFIYFSLNQLWLSPGFQNGTDKRVPPFALARVPISGKNLKIKLI
ncbi:hypothetical protein M422DRAFT_37660 [Sphaerobolus stellatus SS14]|uniref:Major royal jelly protein n=1 Tax=Sphaerobolus stellatus (strain SS14) TaxID=990650 RepID=A0A0C9TE92_SPHS4|nr:hypothetical protein M422DRAFT_37660 [Sphaerobolus stellatus SS14]